jgi:hypothetical protein
MWTPQEGCGLWASATRRKEEEEERSTTARAGTSRLTRSKDIDGPKLISPPKQISIRSNPDTPPLQC